MIYDYEIKHKKTEEILYIYLDINQEFAKLNAKKKKKKLKEMVAEYVKKNKIAFQGTTVAILVGGLIIGTLTLKEPNKEMNANTVINTYAISTLLASKEPVMEQEETKKENKEEVQQEEKKVVQEEKIKKSSTTKQASSSSKTSTKTIVESEAKVNPPIVEEMKTPVTVYRTNGSVITIELEEYVIGVVGAEMPASFHIEALKSQAILARTYALRALEKNIRLTDNSSTQNYKTSDELRKMWGSSYSTYYNKIKNAVEATKGKYLTYNGEIVDAVYHSTSNGRTEDAKNVWGNSIPYLVSVDSPYDTTSSTFTSQKSFSYEDLSSKLGFVVSFATPFEVLSKTEGNRVSYIQIDAQVYSGVTLRNLLGLRSATFEVVKNESGVTFRIEGYGHGVGMSQYGANGMAKNGSSYASILKHYYTGVTISQK